MDITLVKWAGGKTQLIPQYKALFPKNINRYFEPFVGGGAIFFYVKQKFKPKYSMISDINNALINVYKFVRDNPNKLIKDLKKYKEEHSKIYFYEKRKEFNKTKSKIKMASLLIYLNKTCFNGLYRINSKGEFNVPFGKYKKPAILQEQKIIMASNLLKDVEIKNMNFSEILKFAKKGDFVYFDPPYDPLNKTSSFTDYQKTSFGKEDQIKLAEVFKELDKIGCKVMLSNSDTKFIKELYKGFKIEIVKARRMINCNGDDRGKINEIVVVNYPIIEQEKD